MLLSVFFSNVYSDCIKLSLICLTWSYIEIVLKFSCLFKMYIKCTLENKLKWIFYKLHSFLLWISIQKSSFGKVNCHVTVTLLVNDVLYWKIINICDSSSRLSRWLKLWCLLFKIIAKFKSYQELPYDVKMLLVAIRTFQGKFNQRNKNEL